MKKIILNDKYELGLGMGSWAKSNENNVIIGECRKINGIVMYAYSIYKRELFRLDEVNWCPVDESFNTIENLRSWVNK
jgi:hypothetical protein